MTLRLWFGIVMTVSWVALVVPPVHHMQFLPSHPKAFELQLLVLPATPPASGACPSASVCTSLDGVAACKAVPRELLHLVASLWASWGFWTACA